MKKKIKTNKSNCFKSFEKSQDCPIMTLHDKNKKLQMNKNYTTTTLPYREHF